MAKRKVVPTKRRRGSATITGLIVLIGLAAVSQSGQKPGNSTTESIQQEATAQSSRTPRPTRQGHNPTPEASFTSAFRGNTAEPTRLRESVSFATNPPAAIQQPAAIKESTEDYTATGSANVRGCPQTTCDIVAGLVLGQRVVKVGEAQGASVNGSALWYEVSLSDGSTGYVHSGLLRYGTPRPAPVVVQPRATQPSNALVAATQPAAAPTDTAILFEPMTSTPLVPQSPFGCNGADDLNCSDFRAIGQNANAHLAACGDEDNLDGDGDGHACER